METSNLNKIYSMSFSKVYKALVNKVLKKDGKQEDVDWIFCWFTGYSKQDLEQYSNLDICYGDFLSHAPSLNENRYQIQESICGIKVQEMEPGFLQDVRFIDKLVDDLSKGRKNGKNLSLLHQK